MGNKSLCWRAEQIMGVCAEGWNGEQEYVHCTRLISTS